MRGKAHTDSSAGLSTLEALVAVTVLGLALIPILGFQLQMSRAYQRYDQLQAQSQLERNALAALRDINPMEQANGQLTLGANQTLDWASEAITPEKQATGYPVGDSDFVVALYRVDAHARDGTTRQEAIFAIERIGWRRSLASAAPFPDPPR